HRFRPRIMSRLPRRNPQVDTTERTTTIRCQEYFEPITGDGRVGITQGAAELRNQDGAAKPAVLAFRAHVNIPVVNPSSRPVARKVKRDDSSVGVYEESFIAVIELGINSLAQIDGLLPAEIVAGVLTERDENVEPAKTPKAVTAKEQSVLVG